MLTVAPIAALVLAATATLIWPERDRRVLGSRRGPRREVPPRWRRVLPGLVSGPAIALLFPGVWWIGIPVAIGAGWLLDRRGERPSTAERQSRRRALAVRLDLVAACLHSGLPVATALSAVSAATGPDGSARGSSGVTAGVTAGRRVVSGGGPVRGDRSAIRVLEEVAALLAVGADAGSAWEVAAGHPDLASVAAAARRSAVGGSALAAAFSEQAAELRQRTVADDAAAAGRAGVLMTAPLGACFLPAFLCLGLAPAVVGLLGTLQLW